MTYNFVRLYFQTIRFKDRSASGNDVTVVTKRTHAHYKFDRVSHPRGEIAGTVDVPEPPSMKPL